MLYPHELRGHFHLNTVGNTDGVVGHISIGSQGSAFIACRQVDFV
jgi:hypothetical protein